jgi:hypothetical protein
MAHKIAHVAGHTAIHFVQHHIAHHYSLHTHDVEHLMEVAWFYARRIVIVALAVL